MKYYVDIEGEVVSKRHRSMEIWADSEEDAVKKAYNRFDKSIKTSNTIVSNLSSVYARVWDSDKQNCKEFDVHCE